MPTPFEDLYTAVKAMMTLVDAAAPNNVTLAASNYGLDFRVPPGHSVYQVQFFPQQDYARANVKFPQVEVSVAIHHYRTSLANEEAFSHQTMSYVADELLEAEKWKAQSGVKELVPDTVPSISQGAREGNVITFEITAEVLLDAA